MRKLPLIILLAMSSASFVGAQGTTGNADEELRKAAIKYEHDLVEALQKSPSSAADFLERTDADDEVMTTNGIPTSKAERVAAFRSGERNEHAVLHEDIHVRVYGNTAVVTYRGHNSMEIKGKTSLVYYNDLDVLIIRNGKVQRVIHETYNVPAP